MSLLIAAILTTGACASVTTADGRRLSPTSDAFRDYAEAVFRRHNEASTRVALAIEDAPGGADERIDELEQAEHDMLLACEPLNFIAIARRDGREPGLYELSRVKDSVAACDTATRRVETLLNHRPRQGRLRP